MYRAPLIAFAVVTAGIAIWAHWPHSPLPDGVAAAQLRGEPPGRFVMIHGLPNGTPIEIKP